MPIAIKTDLEWGSVWYLKADPNQEEYLLIGLVVEPTDEPKKTRMKFVLSCCGEITTVLPCECTQEKDVTKNPIDEDD